jgi:hypothetical protein
MGKKLNSRLHSKLLTMNVDIIPVSDMVDVKLGVILKPEFCGAYVSSRHVD